MENNYFEANQISEKFALLISKLNSVGLLDEYINNVIIKSPFFDCFENNDLSRFVNLSFEEISKSIFRKEVVFNLSDNFVNKYYWAGLSIMKIMMNYKIPLKRILSIIPLNEFVNKFNPFHEMNPNKICEYYLEQEQNISLLKKLRNDANLSLANIVTLTGINPSILKIMDGSNATLMATSFANLNKLSKLFDISIDVFKKESSYMPFSSLLLSNKLFGECFVKNILDFFNLNYSSNILMINDYVENKDIRNNLKKYKYIIDMSRPFGVIYLSSNRVCNKYLSTEEFYFLYQKTISEFKIQVGTLLF